MECDWRKFVQCLSLEATDPAALVVARDALVRITARPKGDKEMRDSERSVCIGAIACIPVKVEKKLKICV